MPAREGDPRAGERTGLICPGAATWSSRTEPPIRGLRAPWWRRCAAEFACVHWRGAPVASGDAACCSRSATGAGWIRALGLGGLVRELPSIANGSGVRRRRRLQLRLSTAHRHLLDMNRGAVERMQDQLSAPRSGARSRCASRSATSLARPRAARRDRGQARHAEAAALEADPFVRELIERFDATLVESTVRP